MSRTLAEAEHGQQTGLAGVIASLGIEIGNLRGEIRKQRDERYEIGQNIYPIQIPSGFGQVTAAGALNISSAELFGPRTGKVWDVRRVTVAGLASTSESVTLYRHVSTSFARQNTVTSITGPIGTYSPPSAGLIVRAGYHLAIQGTSLTASENVYVSWDAVEISEPWLGTYLL